MKILCTGSRTYTDAERIRREFDHLDPNDEIIHGDAPGADTLVDQEAKRREMVRHVYPAQWNRHGSIAGKLRNRQMLNIERPERVIAFYKGATPTPGTYDTIKAANERRIPITLVDD